MRHIAQWVLVVHSPLCGTVTTSGLLLRLVYSTGSISAVLCFASRTERLKKPQSTSVRASNPRPEMQPERADFRFHRPACFKHGIGIAEVLTVRPAIVLE